MYSNEFQENLANYIKGEYCNLERLFEDLQYFNNICGYEGYIFRGMSFHKPITKSDIIDMEVCSWSTKLEVAEDFASKNRYKYIICKKSRGILISAVVEYLRNNGLLSDKLKNCNITRESEVLDSMYMQYCTVMEII